MAAHAGRLLLPLAIGALVLPAVASAQARQPVPDPYHRDYHTAVRHDPPPPAHAPAWGSWADTPAPWWNQSTSPAPLPETVGSDAMPAWGRHHGHRPDPNLRMAVVPDGQAPDWWSGDQVGSGGWDGAHAPDDRMRHGWRAGWRGAAPGWGGVWWYGWGGDWPAYAADDGDGSGWSGSRGWGGVGAGSGSGWHGTFGIEQGWGGGGRRVIALPAPRD